MGKATVRRFCWQEVREQLTYPPPEELVPALPHILSYLQQQGLHLTPDGSLPRGLIFGLPAATIIQHCMDDLPNMEQASLQVGCVFRPSKSTYIPLRECWHQLLQYRGWPIDELRLLLVLMLQGFTCVWNIRGEPTVNTQKVSRACSYQAVGIPDVNHILHDLWIRGFLLLPDGLRQRHPHDQLFNAFPLERLLPLLEQLTSVLQPHPRHNYAARFIMNLLRLDKEEPGVVIMAMLLLGVRTLLRVSGKCRFYVQINVSAL